MHDTPFHAPRCVLGTRKEAIVLMSSKKSPTATTNFTTVVQFHSPTLMIVHSEALEIANFVHLTRSFVRLRIQALITS